MDGAISRHNDRYKLRDKCVLGGNYAFFVCISPRNEDAVHVIHDFCATDSR